MAHQIIFHLAGEVHSRGSFYRFLSRPIYVLLAEMELNLLLVFFRNAKFGLRSRFQYSSIYISSVVNQ